MSGLVQRGVPRVHKTPGPLPRLVDPRPISGQLEKAVLDRMTAACVRLGVSRCDFLRQAVEERLRVLEDAQ